MGLNNHEIESIEIEDVTEDNQYKVREDLDIEGLKKSIKENGIQYPIDVLKDADGKYTVLNGFRRLAAAKDIGEKEIEARIYTNLEGEEIGKIRGIENNARENWNSREMYKYLKGCIEKGMTLVEIGKDICLKPRQIAKYSAIINWDNEEIIQEFLEGRMKLSEVYQAYLDDKEAKSNGEDFKELVKSREEALHRCSEIEKEINDGLQKSIGIPNTISLDIQKNMDGEAEITLKNIAVANLKNTLEELIKALETEEIKKSFNEYQEEMKATKKDEQ